MYSIYFEHLYETSPSYYQISYHNNSIERPHIAHGELPRRLRYVELVNI